MPIQCDQIELFLKVSATNFLTKVAQTLGIFWALLKTHKLLCKNFSWQLFGTPLENLATFLSMSGHTGCDDNICSSMCNLVTYLEPMS